MPGFHLVVTLPWGDYARGDRITDAREVSDTLDGDHAHHVNKIQAPDDSAAAEAMHTEA